MNATWSLHSHFVCCRLWYVKTTPLRDALATHEGELSPKTPDLSNCGSVSGRAGEPPITLGLGHWSKGVADIAIEGEGVKAIPRRGVSPVMCPTLDSYGGRR